MRAKYWIFSLATLILIGLLVLFFKTNLFSQQDAFYIAVSGPMTGKSEANGKAMVQGIQLYLDKINQQGGLHGKPVKLLIFDDQNQPELAQQVALEIATQSKALAVIGHYASSASLAGGPIYQQYGIPAITGTATADEITKENDWYFRIIFNNSDQGALLANYVRKVLGHEEASVFFDEDAYGSTLAQAFVKTAKMIGLTIKHQWSFNTNDPLSFKNNRDQMIATLKGEDEQANEGEPGEILFLATHSTEAVETIADLRVLKRKRPIIGADAFSSSNFIKKLNDNPQERTQPGYYSDGIYTTAPFLPDLADQLAQDFQQEFIAKYQQEPTITSAMYYDAALMLIHSLKKLPNLKDVERETGRQQLKESLWQVSRSEKAIQGITGAIYFDENGDAVKSIPIGVYKEGRPIVALYQYQPLTSLQSIDNLLQEVLDNRIVQVNGKFMSQAQVVYVGIDFNEVSELNTKNSTYMADFYLWFRFKGDFDDKNIEFINIYNPTANHLEPPIIDQTSTSEGVITRTYRVKTEFKGDFDFHDYPIDKQILPVRFRHQQKTREWLIYVIDTRGMGLNRLGKQGIKEKFVEKNAFSIDGWQLNKVAFFQNTKKNDSTLGIPEMFGSQQKIEYSQFNAAVEIKRYVLSFFLKNLFPTIILIILGYGIFFTNILPTQAILGVNMILPTSLLHLRLYSELPNIAYFMLIEYVFYMIYLLALISILMALAMNANAKHENVVKTLQLAGKIGYPLCVLIAVIAIFYYKVI